MSPRRSRSVVSHVIGVIAPLLLLGGLARADASPLKGRSVVLLCYQSNGGKDQRGCALDKAVTTRLKREGATLMDATQSARLRNQYAPEQFRDAGNLQGINLLDAEIGVVVKLDAAVLDTAELKVMKGSPVKAYFINAALTAVDVSRGVVLASVDESFRVPGALNPEQALDKASKKLAKSGVDVFFDELIAALNAPPTVELWTYGLASLDQIRDLEKAIDDSQVASSSRRTAFTDSFAKHRVVLRPGKTADDLAIAAERSPLLLATQGSTGGMVQLVYDPAHHLKLTLALKANAHKALPRWYRDVMEGLAANQLMETEWVKIVGDGEKTMARVELDAKPSGGGRAQVSARLLSADGKTLAATTERARITELAAAQKQALSSLLDAFRRYLKAHPREFTELKRVFDAPEVLAINVDTQGDGLTLAGRALIADGGQPFATVATTPGLDEGRVRVAVDGGPRSEWVSLSRGAADIPTAALAASVKGGDDLRPVSLTVEVEGRIGPRMYRDQQERALLFVPARSYHRAELASLAGVIDATAAWAKPLASLPAVKGEASDQLARASAVYAAVVNQGVKHQPDLDATADAEWVPVAEPARLFDRGSASDAELAALFASAFETAGTRTLLLEDARGVMIAIDTGLPETAWPAVAPSQKHVIARDGALFVPLDVTVRGSLWSAAHAGSTRVARLRRVEAVSTAEAWTKHPFVLKKSAPIKRPLSLPEPTRALVLEPRSSSLDKKDVALFREELTAQLTALGGLQVLSTDDIKEMLDLEAAKQAMGCDDESCLAEVVDAMGARVAVMTSLEKTGTTLTASLRIADTESASTVGRVSLNALSSENLRGDLEGAALELAVAWLGNNDNPPVGGWDFKAHRGALEKLAGKNAYRRVQILTLAGDHRAATSALESIRDKNERALASAHVLLAAGEAEKALAAYRAIKDRRARVGELVAASALGDREAVDASRGALGDKADALTRRLENQAPSSFRFFVEW